MWTSILTPSILICLTACSAPAPAKPATQRPPETNRLHDDHLPTPFTAAQIRDAFAKGGSIRMRIDEKGKPTVYEMITFRTDEAGQTTGTAWMESLEGKMIGPKQDFPVNWKALQSHASFPAKTGKIQVASTKTPLGSFSALLYEIRGASPGDLEKYWFAPSLPGPPISHLRLVDGKEVYRSTMIDR